MSAFVEPAAIMTLGKSRRRARSDLVPPEWSLRLQIARNFFSEQKETRQALAMRTKGGVDRHSRHQGAVCVRRPVLPAKPAGYNRCCRSVNAFP
jgi:hypothetical protein